MRIMKLLLFACMLLLLLTCRLFAENATTPRTIEAYPTYGAVGVEATYAGDDNANSSAELLYRRQGDTAWRNGVDLTPHRERRIWWASIFPCREGEVYEVRVAFHDPDGVAPDELHARAQIRRIVERTSSGKTYYVSPQGDDASPGTRAAPFRTISAAAEKVKAGGTVRVLPGVYHENVRLQEFAGLPADPIVFAGAGVDDERPVLDGSIELPKDPARWTRHNDAIYFTAIEFKPLYVAEEGSRMYRYPSLAELESGKVKGYRNPKWARPWKIVRGWYYDPEAKRLYLKTAGGDNPGTHTVNVARHTSAFRMTGAKHVVIKGFEMRYYGRAGVEIMGGSEGNMLIQNIIHNAPYGVRISGYDTHNNLAYRNVVWERGLFQDVSWGAVKASRYGRQGFSVHAGRGNSIIENEIYGWFDGIAAVSWKKPDRFEINRDMDIVGNFIHDGGDDGLEPDGGGVNMRIWNNRITRMLVGISLAPIERGPVYVVRNLVYDSGWTMFKLGVGGCTSLGPCYVYHNSSAGTGTAISFPPPPPKGIPFSGKVFKNNAFVIRGGRGLARGRPGNFLDYNCYYVKRKDSAGGPVSMQWLKEEPDATQSERFPDLASFAKATGQETHALNADPLFADAPNGDFRLGPASPLIDRGAVIRGINDDFAGRGPDIGAIEHGGVKPAF